MAQLLVRQIDDDTKLRLQKRAAKHGVSMEEEVRSIIQNAVLKDEGPSMGLGTEIAALFKDIEGWDGELPKMPDEPVRPAKFDE